MRQFAWVSDDQSRGGADFQVSSYDLYAPPWATLPDAEFAALDQNPFVFGEFVWAGIDYLGEPTPYDQDAKERLTNFTAPEIAAAKQKELFWTGKIAVSSRSSYFGILDLAGFRKDRLSFPGSVASRLPNGAYLTPLDLARAHRSGNAGSSLHFRGRS